MRRSRDRVVEAGLLDEQEDLFYLNRWEVGQVLFDAVNSWAQASSWAPAPLALARHAAGARSSRRCGVGA